jgi:lipid-A-disaccharide synthase
LLVPFLDAYLHVQDDRTSVDGRVLVAAHLDRETRDLIHRAALARRIKAVDMPAESGAAPYLAAFDGALCASGTAALECAISGAVPVIAYRVDRVTALVARRLLRTPFVGLPNVLLGAAVYPELLQERAEPRALAEALEHVLDGRAAYDASRSRLAALFEGCTERPADAVASMLLPWIAGGGRGRSALSATEVVGGDLS